MMTDRFWLRMQGSLGLKLTPEQEATINQARQNEIARKERRKQLADALAYSDACPSEAEFVLGFSDEDPHPNHAIQFDSKHPLPDLVSEEYPLVLKNQEPSKSQS